MKSFCKPGTAKCSREIAGAAEAINVCLFCSNLKDSDGATTRPMGTQKLMTTGISGFSAAGTVIKTKKLKKTARFSFFTRIPVKAVIWW